MVPAGTLIGTWTVVAPVFVRVTTPAVSVALTVGVLLVSAVDQALWLANSAPIWPSVNCKYGVTELK